MMSLEQTERGLEEDCEQLAAELKAYDTDKNERPRPSPTCQEDILRQNLQGLRQLSKLTTEAQPDKVLENPLVVADSLISRLDTEIIGAGSFLEIGRKSIAAVQLQVEEKAVFLKEQQQLEKELEDSLLEAECMNSSMNASLAEVSSNVTELENKLYRFLDQHFPAVKDSSLECVGLKSIVQKLIKASARSSGDCYIHISDDFWQPHIEVLLRYSICCRHPDDPRLVKLLYTGD